MDNRLYTSYNKECFNNNKKKYLFNYDKNIKSKYINMADNSKNDNDKFDSTKFNQQVDDMIKKKRENRINKENNNLNNIKQKDEFEKKQKEEEIYRSSYIYYFNRWLFSIPRLIINILTFDMFHLLKDDDILLFIGIWLIVIGVFFYFFLNLFKSNNLTNIEIPNYNQFYNPNLVQ
jgi:hypothetical protein